MLTASCFIARRVISRITDSVKRSAFAESICRAAVTTRLAPAVGPSTALIGEPPPLPDEYHPPLPGGYPLLSRRGRLLAAGPGIARLPASGHILSGIRLRYGSRFARTPLSR